MLFIVFLGIQNTKASQLRFNHLGVENGLSQSSVQTILKDKYGFMWFGTWEGISRFDGYSFKVFRANEDDPTALSNNRINAMITDSAQNIWVSTGDHTNLFRFNYEKENFTRFAVSNVSLSIRNKLNKSRIYGIKNAGNSRFTWKLTTNGLLQTDKQTNTQTEYRANRFTPFSLTDNVLNAIYLDDCENLWIGTQNGGINFANLQNNIFDFHAIQTNEKGLYDNVVRAICKDKNGNLWVGTDKNGVTVIEQNGKGNSYKHYGARELVNPGVRMIYCDRFGFVWIGTKGGLDRFDPRTGKFRHYDANKPGSILHPWVFWIMEDHSGYLWVGTFNGIAKYDRERDRFLCYDPKTTIATTAVRVILEDYKHTMWVATEDDGISKIQRDSGSGFAEKLTAKHYRHSQTNQNSLINNMVLTMTEDAYHKLWIGTNSGLCRLDPETEVFTHFSVKNGFPDDLIMGLLSDGKDHIWVSHKKGLTSIDIKTFQLRNYNIHDGLQGYEFTQNAYYRNPKNGEMFFGGTNGLNSFHPDSILANKYKLKPILTALKVMNEAVEIGKKINNRILLEKSLHCTDKITLTWWDKSFSIEFSALNYTNAYSNKYKYMLEGVDTKWVYTDASMRLATYSNLASGKYVFKVFAANNDGVWSDYPAMLEIVVLAPWWFTWWAKSIYFLLICTLLWFVYRFVSARIEFRNKLLMERLKNEKNEELMNIKLQFFTEISHEFRTPLTLIIDPLEQLLSGSSDEEQKQYYYRLMSKNAKQLLELINQLLDFRKLQSRTLPMTFGNADMVAFVKNTATAFNQKAEEQHIRFEIHTSANQLFIDFDTEKMRIILNNLLSNAFKFTPVYGQITVRIGSDEVQNDKITIEVQDNGIGISPEFHEKVFDPFYQVSESKQQIPGSGIGLAFTKELVNLHGGEILLISEKGKGACFRVVIPTKQVYDNTIQQQIVEPELSEQITISNPSNNEDDSTKPLLLMVDDNVDIRTYFKINFGKKYRIEEAVDGLDGFNKAVETIPDLIISDLMMPGIDGIELCKRLKTDEHTSHIPVILLTARQSDESRIEGYETGADAYVTKPFSSEVLDARITNLLHQRTKLRELFSNTTPVEFRKIAVNVTDEVFLNKVVALIDKNMEATDFDPDILAEQLKMSRSQLYRKIKALTNRTVHDFITTIRMNRAKEYLLSGEFTISEIAYKVGYSLPTNFTRTFTKQFGETPTKYIERHKK